MCISLEEPCISFNCLNFIDGYQNALVSCPVGLNFIWHKLEVSLFPFLAVPSAAFPFLSANRGVVLEDVARQMSPVTLKRPYAPHGTSSC